MLKLYELSSLLWLNHLLFGNLILLLDRLSHSWITVWGRYRLHWISILHHLFFRSQVFVALHLLWVSITLCRGPLTLLYLFVPAFQSNAAMRWFRCRFFLQEIVVVASRFLFKLAAHVLTTVPILLPTTRQWLPAITPHNMTGYLKGMFGG